MALITLMTDQPITWLWAKKVTFACQSSIRAMQIEVFLQVQPLHEQHLKKHVDQLTRKDGYKN